MFQILRTFDVFVNVLNINLIYNVTSYNMRLNTFLNHY